MKFSDLQAKLAALRAQSQQHPKQTLKTIKSEAADSIQEINPTIPINTTTHSGTDRHGNSITYNSRQQTQTLLSNDQKHKEEIAKYAKTIEQLKSDTEKLIAQNRQDMSDQEQDHLKKATLQEEKIKG